MGTVWARLDSNQEPDAYLRYAQEIGSLGKYGLKASIFSSLPILRLYIIIVRPVGFEPTTDRV